MPEANPPNPESEIDALKKKVSALESKLEAAEKKAAYFQDQYFKAAKLGERVIPPEYIRDN